MVTYDDSEISDRAIKYAIYLSKISGAEITILQVLGNRDKLECVPAVDIINSTTNP
ncbi:hypothetical protein BH23THE1_BH23THE1_18700 [soil metagenome]